MTTPLSKESLNVYMSLFRGRQDVFAIRWEKDGRNGYMPAYDLNWDEFSIHKANGGTLKDFANKSYSPLTEQRLLNHLSGKEVIGLYPLLLDNSSWFIAADFDESESGKISWQDEVKKFIDACEKYNLPVYLERSRSGRGGHVWLFFENNYPAFKSRKIMLHILESTGIISPFDKNSNYDRLFPNQDSHSGKGVGNLIALPLQKKSMDNNNSCFIDPVNYMPYPDQWSFLRTIKKVATQQLENIYNSLLKIRFVLQPFSFLFLLQGEKKYHIVWETLNSEEATYVWHFDKTMDALRNGLSEIEELLNEIKNTGKQDYLKKDHPNFSRILHDYSAAQKGFTIWKGFLEQRLV